MAFKADFENMVGY